MPIRDINNSILPQNTENAAMFIVRFAVRYFFGVLVLIGLNFVAWDREPFSYDVPIS